MDLMTGVDKRIICIICCKCGDTVGSKRVKHYLSLLLRHLRLKEGLVKELETCVDCFSLLESYGRRYHEWKCVELQLQLLTDKIRRVMQLADKVPARVEAFQRRYANVSGRELEGPREQGGEPSLIQLRNKLKQKCIQIRVKSAPFVIIQRDPAVTEVKMETPQKLNEDDPMVHAFLGWLTSFLALFFLYHLHSYNESLQKTSLSKVEVDNLDWTEADVESVHSPSPAGSPCSQVDVDCHFNDGSEVTFRKEPPQGEVLEIRSQNSQDVVASGATASMASIKTEQVTRSLRQVHRCQTCWATFSSIAKLDHHSESCHDDHENHSEESDTNTSSSSSGSDDWKFSSEQVLDNQVAEAKTNAMDDARVESEDCEPNPRARQRRKRRTWNGVTKKLLKSAKQRILQRTSTTCKICNAKPHDLKSLALHMCMKHGANGGVINASQIVISLPDQALSIDDYVNPSKTEFACQPCRIGFIHKEDHDSHSKLHGNFSCTFCDAQTAFAVNMAFHVSTNHKSQDLQCDLCNRLCKAYRNSSPFISHFVETHLGLRVDQFRCPICNVAVVNYDGRPSVNPYIVTTIGKHYATHHDTSQDRKVLPCDETNCKAYFLTKPQLTQHSVAAHGKASGRHDCQDCGKGFKNLSKLRIHRLSAHKKNPEDFQFGCKLEGCTARFETKAGLSNHIRTHRWTVNWINCSRPDCKERFRTRKQLEAHLDIHRKTELTCPRCKVCLKDRVKCIEHVRLCNLTDANGKQIDSIKDLVVSSPDEGITIDDLLNPDKTRYSCAVQDCKIGFTSEAALESHKRLHGNFKCHFCETWEFTAGDIALHELSHVWSPSSGGKKVINVSCPRGCKTAVRIAKLKYVDHYVEAHLGLKTDKVLCPICSAPFDLLKPTKKKILYVGTARSLAVHYLTCHDGAEKGERFNCNEGNCKAYFVKKLQLLKHAIQVHGEDDPLKCQDCSRMCVTAHALKVHRERVHKVDEETFKFVCEEDGCEARFEREIQLEYHREAHPRLITKKRRPFKCPENTCGKTFLTEKRLKIHRTSHKKQQCEHCGKIYDKNRAKAHLMTHNPESRKFSCDICGKKFRAMASLKEHLRSHSTAKSFVCQECGQGYVHKHNLRHHLKSKHGIEMETKTRKRVYKESVLKGKTFKRVKLVKTSE